MPAPTLVQPSSEWWPLVEGQRQAPTPAGVGRPRLMRRVAAKAIDLGLLTIAAVWLISFQLSIGRPGEVGWLLLVWLVLVGPLYFTLYHATGMGATPGQRELGVAARSASGMRAGVGASLARAYLGLLFLPLLASIGDRLTKTRTIPLETAAELPPVWAPTVDRLRDVFEPARPGRTWRRARWLMRLHGRQLTRSVLLVYLGLVGVAAVLAPLFISDFNGGDFNGAKQAIFWTLAAGALFTGGIFWKQAAIAVAVEALRTGETIGPFEVVRRAARHANGLTVALLILAAMLSVANIANLLPGAGLLAMALVLARFIFVIPAIAIEERHVLAAFRRSLRITRGNRQWPVAWRIAISAIGTVLVVSLSGLLGVVILFKVVGTGGTIRFAYLVALGLGLASLPTSWALANIGSYWAVYHHDLRRIDQETS